MNSITNPLSAIAEAKKPVRYGLGQPAVQVKATPANPRFRDALGSQQQQQQQQARANTLGVEPNSVPQSSMMSAVPPSSELRPTHVGSSGGRGGSMGIAVEATPLPASAAAVGSLVMATPCRRGTNSLLLQPPPNGRGQDDDNVVLPSSPLYVRKPAAAADSTSQAAAAVDVSDVEASTPVPTSRRQRVSWPPGHLRAKSMGSLPRAAAAVPSSVPRTPLGKDSATASARALSIYQKLGWDDEFDDLA